MLGKFINHKEDSLTAAVFTHLLHLPVELFWQILRNASYTTTLPEDPGDLFQVNFWPSWNPSETNNTQRVVPDLFLRFGNLDLIIEAKRWDDWMQDHAQWQSELIAYTNEYGEEKRPVRMIALGGIHTTPDEDLSFDWHSRIDESSAGSVDTHRYLCPVHMCRWNRLLEQCTRMHRELQSLEYRSSQARAFLRILLDVIDLFAWHGFSTGLWFVDFRFAKCRLSPSIASHAQFFQSRSKQLATK